MLVDHRGDENFRRSTDIGKGNLADVAYEVRQKLQKRVEADKIVDIAGFGAVSFLLSDANNSVDNQAEDGGMHDVKSPGKNEAEESEDGLYLYEPATFPHEGNRKLREVPQAEVLGASVAPGSIRLLLLLLRLHLFLGAVGSFFGEQSLL